MIITISKYRNNNMRYQTIRWCVVCWDCNDEIIFIETYINKACKPNSLSIKYALPVSDLRGDRRHSDLIHWKSFNEYMSFHFYGKNNEL